MHSPDHIAQQDLRDAVKTLVSSGALPPELAAELKQDDDLAASVLSALAAHVGIDGPVLSDAEQQRIETGVAAIVFNRFTPKGPPMTDQEVNDVRSALSSTAVRHGVAGVMALTAEVLTHLATIGSSLTEMRLARSKRSASMTDAERAERMTGARNTAKRAIGIIMEAVALMAGSSAGESVSSVHVITFEGEAGFSRDPVASGQHAITVLTEEIATVAAIPEGARTLSADAARRGAALVDAAPTVGSDPGPVLKSDIPR